MRFFLFFCLGIVFSSCDQAAFIGKSKNLREVKAYSEEGYLQMVVTAPTGTIRAYEYNEQKNKLVASPAGTPNQVMDFLPYPGNFGFIPTSGAGAMTPGLDVLLLSEALPKGSVVEIIPIAALLLKGETGTMTKIIAVPQDASLRVIQAVDFPDFLIKYDAAKRIIEEWFTHYRGVHKVISLGWRDQSYALSLVPKL